ncbi:iron complex transport system substrate-binding protein [Corynebacterium appendicis CIP 107643]|uniref:Iron complex transport system substrate-binding protein n=1 Tax=Corynebacterium appendicis CIP 107643 TaxID=1161099 RepID=A0A1N7KAY1_9CORY|nr:hypothetical protein [Corynebacterium appendicis]WJY60528.1 hypothetical protein CAPP_02960 [Corynebacterium appendicis CIP 107643]SIS58768.1 iron complex transport system substrate-binding protein [Corynebacterium appendicis CIP 107643]
MLLTSGALLAACATPADEAPQVETTTSSASNGSVEIEDNEGVKTVPAAPERVVAQDARSRELLEALGVEVQDPGGDADLVVAGTADGAAAERPDGMFVDLTPRDGIPLDWEIVRQVQVLGKIFVKEDEAAELDKEFSEARGRAIEARSEKWTFSALTVNGTEVAVQPADGDALWRPLFEMLELTPALKPEDPADILALVKAKPRFIFVNEVQKDLSAEGYIPPMRVLVGNDELKKLDPVEGGRVYVAPLNAQDTASAITYTRMFNELADQWKNLD